MEREMEAMRNDIIGLRRDLDGMNRSLAQEKIAFNDDVQKEFTKYQLMLQEVVTSAKE